MNVIAMRRELSAAEMAARQRSYPGQEIHVHQTAPRSAAEHLADCRRLDVRLVFLADEAPIPTSAMKEGVKHLLLKDGKLMELVSVVPQFAPHTPL